MNFELEIARNKNIEKYIDLIAQWRIEHFREFPYLYEGKIENERKYLKHYAVDPKGMVILAKQQNEIIGIVTGIPFSSETSTIAALKALPENYSFDEYYYLGEIIIPGKFRGMGLMRSLCEKQEFAAKEMGFSKMCLLTVIRNKDHSLMPDGYKSSDDKFAHYGYVKTAMTVDINWPTIQIKGSVKEAKNSLALWLKNMR